MGRSATASYAAGNPGSTSFLLTVSYGSGESATSGITVEWSDEDPSQPNRAPVAQRWADNYLEVAGSINAPPATLVSKRFYGVFSDPDGDDLTYTYEITSGNADLVEEISITLPDSPGVPSHVRVGTFPRLFVKVEDEAGWKAVTPALPDPITFTVTLTATDPGGLSTSLTSDFVTNWASDPEVVSAVADWQAIELTFDLELQANPAPTPSQFTVNVTNEDGSTGTVVVSGVSISGKAITLDLASALAEGQTVSVDYAHDDEAPIQRAGGGDSVPSFDGQAVDLDLALPPVNFEARPALGTMDLLATWDEAADATSYKLRWRLADGAFDADDALAVSGQAAVITVPDFGAWEVRLQACNDEGCGPETSRTVDVSAALNLNLSPTRDSEGNVRSRTITATWDPVPRATSYTLSWQRIDQHSQTQGQRRSAASGPSGASGQGANGEGDNQLTLPADRTGVDFSVPDDGEYRARLRANTGDDRMITEDTASVNQEADQPDETPPRIVRGEIDGPTMTIYFSEPLDPTAKGGRFSTFGWYAGCACYVEAVRNISMIKDDTVTVNLGFSLTAVEGRWSFAYYWTGPGETAGLRDQAGNRLSAHLSPYGYGASTSVIALDNLTGPPLVLSNPRGGSYGPPGVAITSNTGTYVSGEQIQVTLRFSEPVDVTGAPRLRIDLDPAPGGERWAEYTSGTGSNMLVFSYTVAAEDSSESGVAVLPNTLQLNSGTIRSASLSGEDAKLGHAGLDHDPAHKVVSPTTGPPALLTASVTGPTLTLSFSETLGEAASLANNAFTVKKTLQNGTEEMVSVDGTPVISGATVTLTLASAVLDTDSGVTVRYVKPDTGANNKLIDVGGNEAESFTDQPVINTLDTTKPDLLRGEINGDVITLYFSEALDEQSGGTGDFFRLTIVRVDSKPGFLAQPREVLITGNKVVITLRPGKGTSYGMWGNWLRYYTPHDPTADRIRDISGNAVSTPFRYNSWADRAPWIFLDNLTPPPSSPAP
jgi:uncharacterized repeat protein (TIGR02059 family)